MDQRLNIVKMSLVLKLTYIFHVIPVRISAHFAHACMCMCENEYADSKIYIEMQRTKDA